MNDAPEVSVVQAMEYRKFVILQWWIYKSSVACPKAKCTSQTKQEMKALNFKPLPPLSWHSGSALCRAVDEPSPCRIPLGTWQQENWGAKPCNCWL